MRTVARLTFVVTLAAALAQRCTALKQDLPISLSVSGSGTYCVGEEITLVLHALDHDYCYDVEGMDSLVFRDWPGDPPELESELGHEGHYKSTWKTQFNAPIDKTWPVKADDGDAICPGGGSDDEEERTVRAYVIGGPITQTSPPSGEAVVHWTCSQHAVDSAEFSAAPNQLAGTIYHWTFTNSAIARFKVGNYLYSSLSGNYPNVTVVAADGRDAGTCQTAVKLEYELNGKRCAAPNEIPVKSQTSAHMRVVSQMAPYPWEGGYMMDTVLQVTDQCTPAHDYQRVTPVSEYRPQWCIDGFDQQSRPPTSQGWLTQPDGHWVDHTGIPGGYPEGWCAKANQYWRAAGCSTSDTWFCQQWYTAWVAHTQKPGCVYCGGYYNCIVE